jgi:hypothetical protein
MVHDRTLSAASDGNEAIDPLDRRATLKFPSGHYRTCAKLCRRGGPTCCSERLFSRG